MKRTGVVVTVVAVAAVVGWVGATWYTGGKIEAAARQAVADANAANLGATGELVSYERSLFSATSRYKVTMPLPPQGEPVTILIDSHVNHGPLPLDRLARIQLKPVSATIDSTLARNEGVGTRLKTAEADATVRAYSVIDFNENVAFDVTTPALRMEQDGATTEVAAGSFTGTAQKAQTLVKMEGKIASVRAETPAPNPLTIDVRDLTLNVDTRVGRFGVQVGDSAFRIGGFTVNGSSPEGGALAVKGDSFGVAYHVVEDDKNLTGHIAYNLGKLVLNNTELGDFDLRLAARQLDGVATAKLANAYQKMVMTNPSAGGPDAMRQAMTVLDAPIREVVASKPVLALDSLIWTTPLGQSTLKMEATLAPSAANAAPSVERATVDLSVSQPALVDTIARFTKTGPGGGPITLTQANQQANMQVGMMVSGAAKEKLLVVKDGKIETHVTFDGKTVLINGQEPPPHLIAGLLGMVPFGQ